jgi:hypothetical protein
VNVNVTTQIGRGLFQNYRIQDKVLTLYTIYTTDINGDDWDPFCIKGADVSSVWPDIMYENATRSNNNANFCARRKTTAGVAILTVVFGFAALAMTYGAQKGCCGQMPFIVCVIAMVVTCIVVCANMGRFVLKTRKDTDNSSLDPPVFPNLQSTDPGYSLILFVCCIFLYIVTLALSACEMCCGRDQDDKFDNSQDVERVMADVK